MPVFVPGDLVVEVARHGARSALPDAPVVSEEATTRPRPRARLGTLLRVLASVQLRLAERVDPSHPPAGGGRPAGA